MCSTGTPTRVNIYQSKTIFLLFSVEIYWRYFFLCEILQYSVPVFTLHPPFIPSYWFVFIFILFTSTFSFSAFFFYISPVLLFSFSHFIPFISADSRYYILCDWTKYCFSNMSVNILQRLWYCFTLKLNEIMGTMTFFRTKLWILSSFPKQILVILLQR